MFSVRSVGSSARVPLLRALVSLIGIVDGVCRFLSVCGWFSVPLRRCCWRREACATTVSACDVSYCLVGDFFFFFDPFFRFVLAAWWSVPGASFVALVLSSCSLSLLGMSQVVVHFEVF